MINNNNENKVNELYMKCSCGSEILNIEESIDFFDAPQIPYNREFYFSIFNYRYKKRNLFERIIIAFKYIIKGSFHTDQMILKEDEMNKLLSWTVKCNENFYDMCQNKIDENYESTLPIIPADKFEEITGIDKKFNI